LNFSLEPQNSSQNKALCNRLQTRGVSYPPCCNYCKFNTNLENHWHIFFGCDQVKKVSDATGLWNTVHTSMQEAQSTTNLIFNLIDTLPEDLKRTLVITSCGIWKRRNEKIWENKTLPPSILVSHSLQFLAEWSKARGSASTLKHTSNHSLIVGQTIAKCF